MADRILSLTLGGQERTLLFGTMGYFTYIKEGSGKEPLEWLQQFDERIKDENKVLLMIEDLSVFVYAGLNSHLDSKDQPNVPIEKVRKWCNGIKNEDAAIILRTAFGTITTDQPGEQNSQPVNGSEVKALA